MLPTVVAFITFYILMLGLTTTAGKQLSKILEKDSCKEGRVLGRLDSSRQQDLSHQKPEPIKRRTYEYLPPLEGLIKQFPEVPRNLLDELLISRERYLNHLNSKWDSKDVDK